MNKNTEWTLQNIRILVSLTIGAGKLEQFRTIAAEMSRGCRAEPGTLAYEWFISPDHARCRPFEAYAGGDARALQWRRRACRSRA
jgi:quinol monooxygenase YgiN